MFIRTLLIVSRLAYLVAILGIGLSAILLSTTIISSNLIYALVISLGAFGFTAIIITTLAVISLLFGAPISRNYIPMIGVAGAATIVYSIFRFLLLFHIIQDASHFYLLQAIMLSVGELFGLTFGYMFRRYLSGFGIASREGALRCLIIAIVVAIAIGFVSRLCFAPSLWSAMDLVYLCASPVIAAGIVAACYADKLYGKGFPVDPA